MKKRVEYIDIFRGIGIVFMVLGHIRFGTIFDHYIHAFHIPLFFFASGLFFKADLKFSDYIKKITKQLLLPYFFWSFFFSIIVLCMKQDNLSNILYQVFIINNNGFPIAGALWFLTSFYFSQLIIYIFKRMIKSDLIITIIVFLFMLLGVYFYPLFGMRLFLSFDTSLVGIFILWIGYLVNKHGILEKVTSSNIIITLILLLINYIMIINTSIVNVRTDTYPNVFIFIFNCILSFVVYINLSKIIIKYFSKRKLTNMLLVIGRNSIVSLCLNQFVILLISKLFYFLKINNLFFEILKIPGIFYQFLFSIIVLAILYCLSVLLMKTKLKILFGK